MVFSSNIFIYIFLPAVLLVYYLFKNSSFKNYILLVASIGFYAWGEPIYVFLMLGSIITNYVFGLLIDKSESGRKKLFLILALILNLSALFVFKYSNFAIENINRVFSLSISKVNLSLPIGISFFTFQSISYIIDVYRKDCPAQKNLFYLGLYISFFPQLIAGPIVRYNTVCDQIVNRKENWEKFDVGIKRFVTGLAKKVILANSLSTVADAVFRLAETKNMSVMMAWLGALCFTFQIYFDFSGYSDMAIGLGKMFGFDFLENFNYPYISSSVTEFWRRWHMSLGQWFRDYVYFPLGGSRTSAIKIVRNLMVVWLLTGIWHGASWNFVLWGVLYGIIITFEKLTKINQKNSISTKIIFIPVTFVIVVLGWVLFGASSLGTAFNQISAMFGFGGNGLTDSMAQFYLRDNIIPFVLSVIFSTPLPSRLISKMLKSLKSDVLRVVMEALIYIVLLVLSCSILSAKTNNPFLYFNF